MHVLFLLSLLKDKVALYRRHYTVIDESLVDVNHPFDKLLRLISFTLHSYEHPTVL